MTEVTLQQRIAMLRADIAGREKMVARLQAEVVQIEREVDEFRAQYDRIVGAACRRVQAAKAAIDDLLEQRRLRAIGTGGRLISDWQPPPDYVSVEEQYRRVWKAPLESADARPPTPLPPVEPVPVVDSAAQIKQLYRELARRFHPDLCTTTDERARRTEIMTRINDAYAARDLATLRTLAAQPERESAPLEVLTLRGLLKERDELDDRIVALKGEREALLASEMMKLKLDAKLARMKGRDLLRELADGCETEYYELVAQLDRLKRGLA